MLENKSKERLGSLISFLISILIFSFLAGGVRFWDAGGQSIPFLWSAFSITALAAFCTLIFYKRSGTVKDFRFSPSAAAAGLVVYFASDYCCRGFNLFQGPSIRAELIAVWIILLITWDYISERTLKYFLLASIAVLFLLFIYLSAGRPVVSDDHASFIFRLSLLKKYFPDIPLYYPGWNAGLDARDFFATGALGYFLLTAPLHYIFDVNLSHNLALISVLFLILPASLGYSCRLLGLSKGCSYIAAILSLATSLIWYRWALKYGTVGFITSASLMPIVFVLAYRLLNSERLSKRQLFLLIALGSVSIMWPLGAVCYLSLAVLALLNLKSCLRNRQLILTVAVLILINLPWAVTFWKVSGVARFVNHSSSQSIDNKTFRHKAKGLDLAASAKVLRETANSTNPLIIFLALPGIFLLPKKFRNIFAFQSILFLLGGTVLVAVKPQLELDRLLVFLSVFLCIPVALALKNIFNSSFQNRAVCCFAFSFLFLSPFIAASILHNRSAENYSFSGQVSNDIKLLASEYPSTGRYLFSGFILHELDGGHVAPLTEWTGKPFMASSQFHNKWSYTSIFPASFAAKGESGITEFLNLYNAEIIFAHEPVWRTFFSDRPEQYELIWHKKPFMVFRRKNFKSDYFLSGKGQILEQDKNKLVLQTESDEAVIKFNYFPFLKSSNCQLSAFDVGTELPFIRLSGCNPGESVIIESVSPLERVIND